MTVEAVEDAGSGRPRASRREPPRLVRVLAAMTEDLTWIADNIGWAYSLGWDAPAQLRDPNSRGTSLAHLSDADADFVPGAERDPGVGVHGARQAVRNAGDALAEAAHQLSLALAAVDPAAELVVTVKRDTPLAGYRLLVRLVDVRLTDVSRLVDGHGRLPAATERHTLDAQRRVASARGALAATIDRGPARQSDVDAMCAICEIRPRGGRGRNRSGHRCKTCERWFYTHGRRERPRSLDQHRVQEALEAKQQRTARGEGWGST